jgi:hypothetical protein
MSNYSGEDFTRTIDEIEFENKYKDSKSLLSAIDDPTKALEARQPVPPKPA